MFLVLNVSFPLQAVFSFTASVSLLFRFFSQWLSLQCVCHEFEAAVSLCLSLLFLLRKHLELKRLVVFNTYFSFTFSRLFVSSFPHSGFHLFLGRACVSQGVSWT